MTQMIIFEFRPQDGMLEKLIEFFDIALPDTRRFPGNQGATAARQTWDEYQLVIITYWANESDMEKFIAWRKKEGDYAKLRTLLDGKPLIRTYDVLDIGGSQKPFDEISDSAQAMPIGVVHNVDFNNKQSTS